MFTIIINESHITIEVNIPIYNVKLSVILISTKGDCVRALAISLLIRTIDLPFPLSHFESKGPQGSITSF